MCSTTQSFNNNIPSVECSLTKCEDYYICKANFYNIPKNSEIAISALKSREIVSFNIRDYTTAYEEFFIFADFDFVTVLVIDSSNKISPIVAVCMTDKN